VFWRADPSGQRFALRLTTAAIAAVGGADPTSEQTAPAAADPVPVTATEEARSPAEVVIGAAAEPHWPGGKLGRVIEAVAAETGATLADLVALTGWQPHTARAALTGLRQRGFAIQLADQQGRKAYRLTAVR
jgi:hypothetical protein